ncbi:MAG TPA: glycosyltransferase family 2 protein [Thermoanaerobaculia bacterium]|nr:glycosyltransferase family 2 protein [Thermoanaerobaculia bacterium]
MRLSICMVSLNCRRVVEDCLESLRRSRFTDFEILCADNGSTDGTLDYLRAQPDVHLIENGWNAGFTRGTNQGIAAGTGEYVLWLNTDTILREDSLGKLIEFMETHPRAGVVGPKVLNADGTFQPQCKRGVPTPFASLCYALGLDRIWPQNKSVSQYLLRSISEESTSIVDAVSGCCLLTRRATIDEVGPLDEEMFGFGEDIDWCVRASKAGWEVWYYPGSVITHLKGQGGAHSKPYRKIRAMHQCMWLFYKKHLAPQRVWPVTALVALGIGASFLMRTVVTWMRRTVA